MKNEICRAITFISYHIPIVMKEHVEISYSTTGYFDGMLTERLNVCYQNNELQELWRYGLKLATDSKGQYSHQNILCFSNDRWNKECSDAEFWSEQTNQTFPLTFVTFLQLKDYNIGNNTVEDTCRLLNKTMKQSLDANGKCYTYCTVDKNDFVICLKCKYYNQAVKVIKNLHNAIKNLVYSYTILSVSNKVLEKMSEEEYPEVYEQVVDSICLKGITNSYDPKQLIALDAKYHELCETLVERLYGEEKEDADYKIYDILGEDDFRLVARDVNLGKLLQQFSSKGVLCYKEKEFQFHLFSSNLVFNTLLQQTPEAIDINYKKECLEQMEQEFQSPICDQLEEKMGEMLGIVKRGANIEYNNEKVLTFSHAIWQLLQSLKVLEIAPVKKYDFWSLYEPLTLLIEILNEKISECNEELVSENEEIYDFIQKISMTLHGTLRTDIQFSQIKDFNAVVHYAPAKLRAFYALWTLKLSDLYNSFGDCTNRYSFILAPGMFRETSVKQLFTKYEADKRLMLITIPERRLYSLRWLPIIISHEVAHFVGFYTRNRKFRHFKWLESCQRVLALEMQHYRHSLSPDGLSAWVEQGLHQSDFDKEVGRRLFEEEKIVREKMDLWPHAYHSDNSFTIIKKAFRSVTTKHIRKIITDDCYKMNAFLQKKNKAVWLSKKKHLSTINEIREYAFEKNDQILELNQRFQLELLVPLLHILKYIYTEAHADITAILTLHLTPEEYILSFTKGELQGEVTKKKLTPGLLVCMRAGCLIRAVESVIDERKKEIGDEAFVKAWSGNVINRLPRQFKKDSVEQNLAIDIYCYDTGVRDCSQNIKEYKCIYEYAETEEGFVNKQLDFLNDQVVYNNFLSYLIKSAESYIEKVTHDSELREKREQLKTTYKTLSGNSVLSIVQEIEGFLAKYEKKT